MLKECVILNGKVINIGPWDYQYQEIDGQQIAMNPLPEGAVIEEREVAQDADGGWYVVGEPKPPTPEERTRAIEDAILGILIGGMPT